MPTDDTLPPFGPLEVERRRSGSGLVVSLHFSKEEADEVLQAARFHDMSVTAWCREQILEQAWRPHVRIYH